MTLCDKDCIPCCDFCIHTIHDSFVVAGETIKGGPIGCKLHRDKEKKKIAVNCGYCDDFHCFRAGEN